MTGQGAAEAAPRNSTGRRAQLEAMKALQRRLNDIKSCECPEDCRAEGRNPTSEQEDNNNDNSNNSQEHPQTPSNNPGGNDGDNPENPPDDPPPDPPSGNPPSSHRSPPTNNPHNETGNNAAKTAEGTKDSKIPTSFQVGGPRDISFGTSQTNPFKTASGVPGSVAGSLPPTILGGLRDIPFDTSQTDPSKTASDVPGSDGGNAANDKIPTSFEVGGPRDFPRSNPFRTPQNTRVVGTSTFDSHRGGDYLPGQVSRRARARTRSKVLARARGAKSIDLERTNETGRLRMSLQVHADPQGHLTRLGYYADLFLKLDEPGRNSGPEEEHHIGYISTWRLSKEPNQYTHEDFQPWVTEWLRGELGGPDDDSRPFKETLRLLYDETGQLRAVNNDSLRSALGDTGSDLIFVEMIWIKYKDEKTGFPYSSQRIAAHALELLYSLMNNGTLPAWYSINLPVTFILRPGMPSDAGLSEMWLKERPRTSDETDQQYSHRIADIVEAVFRSEDRYGFINVSDDHNVLALTVAFPNRERIVDSLLEDETDPALEPAQPAPKPVSSSIRC